MTISKPPVEDFATDFDHTDPEWVANPFPIWDELRETCPVAHTERYGGAWLPTRYADVSAIAHDTEHFTSRTVVIGNGRPGEDAPPAPMGVAPPISSDPPFHAMARRLMQPAFSPKSIEPYNEFTRSLCRRLLAPFSDASQIDISADYAEHIPTLVIAHMIGFPPEDEALFREFVHVVLEAVDAPVEERIEMFEPIRIYFEKQIMDHVDNPRGDLTDFLLNAEIAGQKLAPEHVFGTMVLLIVAGIDTTWSAIGSSLWYLAQHPDEAEKLRHDPELMSLAIEEFLRAFAPVNMARLVKEDFDFNGCPMKKDDWILLSFPAANRDPEVFEDADKVIIDRKVNRHAAFGLGIHRCLGSNLARMEMRIAIEEFLAHFSTFSLADPSDVVWSQGQVRGVRKAVVNIT